MTDIFNAPKIEIPGEVGVLFTGLCKNIWQDICCLVEHVVDIIFVVELLVLDGTFKETEGLQKFVSHVNDQLVRLGF